MTENRKAKELVVSQISNSIKKSNGLVVFEYHGLNVATLSLIRNELREEKVKLSVMKNRLVKLAAKNNNHDTLESILYGPNVFAFLDENALGAIKIIVKYAKKFPAIKIKGGIYENRVVNAEELKLIASLPTYEEALTILAMSLQAPLHQVGVGLKMLVDENHIKAE